MQLYPVYCTNPECGWGGHEKDGDRFLHKTIKADDYKTFDEYLEGFKNYLDTNYGESLRKCFKIEEDGFIRKTKKPECLRCGSTELSILDVKLTVK